MDFQTLLTYVLNRAENGQVKLDLGRVNSICANQPYSRLVEPSDAVSAAYLVLVYLDEKGQPNVVLGQRAKQLRNSPLRWSFPGGKLNPRENPQLGASRETEEEIGIPFEKYLRIAQFGETEKADGYRMAHFLALANEPPRFDKNDAEVADVRGFPISELALATFLETPKRQKGRVPMISLPGLKEKNPWRNSAWGPTAAVLWAVKEFFNDLE